MNTEGRAQYARRAIVPPGVGRPDWEILRALSEEVGKQLPYNCLEEIRIRVAELAPSIIRVDSIEPIVFENLVACYGAEKAKELKPGILADSVDVRVYVRVELLYDGYNIAAQSGDGEVHEGAKSKEDGEL